MRARGLRKPVVSRARKPGSLFDWRQLRRGIVTLTGYAWQKSDGKLGELGHAVFWAHVS